MPAKSKRVVETTLKLRQFAMIGSVISLERRVEAPCRQRKKFRHRRDLTLQVACHRGRASILAMGFRNKYRITLGNVARLLQDGGRGRCLQRTEVGRWRDGLLYPRFLSFCEYTGGRSTATPPPGPLPIGLAALSRRRSGWGGRTGVRPRRTYHLSPWPPLHWMERGNGA